MRYILLFILQFFAFFASAQNAFSINGKSSQRISNGLFLIYQPSLGAVDTIRATIRGRKFSFNGKMQTPMQVQLHFNSPGNNVTAHSIPLYLEPGSMTLKLKHADGNWKATLSGSKTQDEFLQLEEDRKKIADNENRAESIRAIENSFVKTHPASVISAELLAINFFDWGISNSTALFNGLTEQAKNSIWGAYVQQRANDEITNSAGQQAQQFTARTLQGDSISFEDFRGKVVLLEFWASWCGPCIKGFPALKQLVSKYDQNKLTVIAISEDHKEEDWREAVKREKLESWVNVLSGFKIENVGTPADDKTVSRIYGISASPTRMLISPTGKILGRWRGENNSHYSELQALLDAAFANQ